MDCAALEASARLYDAAVCYTALVEAQPTSSAASCSFLRVRQRWKDKKQGRANEASIIKWRALALRIHDVPHVDGAAGRCITRAADPLWLDALLPVRTKPAVKVNAKAHQRTEAGRAFAANGKFDEARAQLRAAIAADATHGAAYLWLGVVESHMGLRDAALEHLRTAERLLGGGQSESLQMAATAAFETGNLFYHIGQREHAETAYRRALRTNPRYAEAHSNMGVLAYTAGRHAEAAASFEAAIKTNPAFANAHQHLGAARKALGDAEGALASYHEAARLSPSASEPLRGVALVLRERGRLNEALDAIRRALLIAPAEPQLYLDRGITHDYAERRELAMEAYAAAAALEPGAAWWHADAGPSTARTATYLHGRAAKSMALWRGWDAYTSFLRRAVRQPGGAAALAVDPVASLSAPFTGPELLAVVTAAAATKLAEQSAGASSSSTRTALAAAPTRPMLRRGGRRLSVGLVSSYFRDHNLLRLCRSLFSQADHSTIRLVLFAESADDGSTLLRETQRAVDGFVRIRSMATADAMDAMAAEGLHIAINLNGHHWNSASESVRFALFGPASASVSAAYMGYPGPTGAPNLQYTYVDVHAVPARHHTHFTERLVQLPHTYYLNDYAQSHARLPRAAAIPPSADGLTRRCLYMCSLNQLPKLDPRLYSAWLNTLRRAASGGPPCTRLWLLKFPASGEAWLQKEAAAHLSPPPRRSLVGLPTVTHADHLLRAQHCDLKLDATLCNAHTSGTDALWAGTPMLTLPGETQAARVAVSLLQAVGQPQLVAQSTREFEDVAVAFAADTSSSRQRWRLE